MLAVSGMAGSELLFANVHEAMIASSSPGNNLLPADVQNSPNLWRVHMPILLWLIGVPLSIIVLLMLFGVLHI